MLDHCSISHRGGVVLWSRSFTPEASHVASSATSPVNSLIREALIEGRTAEQKYEKDGYAVKWTFFNDLELIFVVAYQRILQLAVSMKALFIKLFEANGDTSWNFAKAFDGWDGTFEDKAAQERKSRFRPQARAIQVESESPSEDDSTVPTESHDVTQDEQQIARNVQALKNRLRGRGGRHGGRVAPRADSGASGPIQKVNPANAKLSTKTQRKWGDEVPTESDMATLDFSLDKPDAGMDASLGTRTKDGLYEVKDWDFGNNGDAGPRALLGALGSLFARLTGSKVLTEQDLKPVLEGMKQHLMKKNVAKEIADKVCESVGEGLVGKKVGGFQTTSNTVRSALSASLTSILTPKTSTDLLLSIRTKLSSPSQRRVPYSITFVGVNGVGKSTNLSKVCFWLIQNNLRVLIAACDTFRSGAVEQLRVHVRNLSMLGVDGATDSKGRVELFEKGYGKDAADHCQGSDCTRQVDQLTKFDRALRDFSSASSGKSRGIDGMLVGAALSMTYVTGQPIIFVGCGQTYTDLRQLRVDSVVQAILSD
ncbi:hypothetical protein BKA83DRAFT_4168103 [Pisolithus microcarpus]|nr:hypothetical protein BKA83DRAFT_4168103 [Pisolithus microcarpus]